MMGDPVWKKDHTWLVFPEGDDPRSDFIVAETALEAAGKYIEKHKDSLDPSWSYDMFVVHQMHIQIFTAYPEERVTWKLQRSRDEVA